MENVTDALKMAGSVLLFVIALSVAVLAFSNARQTIDAVLKYSDREYMRIENDSRFYYFDSTGLGTNRYVGKETIIPAIYRAYKENYKIIFDFTGVDSNYYLFQQEEKQEDNTMKKVKVNKIDLSEQAIGSDLESRRFLDGIIYGKYTDFADKNEYEEHFNIELNSKCLYKFLTEYENTKLIKESLGTYYMEDELGYESADSDVTESSSIPEVNKQKKRVITYTFINKN